MKTKLLKRQGKKTPGEFVIMPVLSSPGKFIFYCPGCKVNHVINTQPSRYRAYHKLTGTYDKPTVRASVLSHPKDSSDKTPHCHSFITNGKIEFLKDCTHHLAGKTVDLTPL